MRARFKAWRRAPLWLFGAVLGGMVAIICAIWFYQVNPMHLFSIAMVGSACAMAWALGKPPQRGRRVG